MKNTSSPLGKARRRHRVARPLESGQRFAPRLALLFVSIALFACQPADPSDSFRVPSRFWLEAPQDQEALSVAIQQIRLSVAQSLSTGVLETGFPLECTVTEPAQRAAPNNPKCLEGGTTPDGLLLDSSGRFLQFVPIDFLSARAFAFEVFLIPDAATASILTPEALLDYPHVAIPHFPLPEASYREWLSAVVRGIRASGAEPL